MAWQQLHLMVDRARAEAVEAAVLECGALSVTLTDSGDDPVLEPGVGETPLWHGVRITGLFEDNRDREVIAVHLGRALPALTAGDLQWETLEDQPWERAWMADFEAIQCGRRLWICPSWQQPPAPEAVNLVLDPGLAFGAGTHPTTFLCLQWLDTMDLTDKTLVDYGCGSGILGIAALLLGARQVIAVDNDPQALSATRDNLARNQLAEHRLSAHLPDQAPARAAADILVANILAQPLIELAPRLTALIGGNGYLCLSGLTAEQVPPVIAAYPDFDFEAPAIRDNWARLVARRRP